MKRKKPKAKRVGQKKKIVAQLQGTAEDWLAFVSLQRGRLVRDVKTLCEEIAERVAESPVFAHREDLLREVRQHLESLVHRLNAGTLIEKAIDSAKMKQRDLFSFLNVPSQQELKQLQRKLNQIETRLNAMRRSRGAGAGRSTPTAN